MALFDLGPQARDQPARLHRFDADVDTYEHEIEEIAWANLEDFTGEPLFRVSRQAHLAGGGIVDILALDPDGRVVLIEIKRDVDRDQLAQCLEYAGWARHAQLDSLAKLYHGREEFFGSWSTFTGDVAPKLIQPPARLVLIARDLHHRTNDAVKFLKEGGIDVTVVTVTLYEDAAGRRLADVSVRPEAGNVDPSTKWHSGVDLSDLLDHQIIRPDEPIEWHTHGQIHAATVEAGGVVAVPGVGTFTTLSGAAGALESGSFNGWDRWTVPRLGMKMTEARVNIGRKQQRAAPENIGRKQQRPTIPDPAR